MGEGVLGFLENSVEALGRVVAKIEVNAEIFEGGEGGEDWTVDGVPVVVEYSDVGEVVGVDGSHDGRLDLLWVKNESYEGAEGREPFGNEGLHVCSTRTFCDSTEVVGIGADSRGYCILVGVFCVDFGRM